MSNHSGEESSPPMASDDLLRAARVGNSAAVGKLLEGYSAYFILLTRVQIGAKLRGKVDPSDIVQETFLSAHRQFSQFRGQSERELLAWLRRILAGQLAMTFRQYLGTQGRDVRLEREIADQLDRSSASMDGGLAASGSSPSQTVSRREQAVLLAEALSRLPEDYREVIVLRHLEALSFADIAARMGRSGDSVEKLWVRALGQLRREMEGQA